MNGCPRFMFSFEFSDSKPLQGYIFFPIRGQNGREKKSDFEKQGKKIKDEKGRKIKKKEEKRIGDKTRDKSLNTSHRKGKFE